MGWLPFASSSGKSAFAQHSCFAGYTSAGPTTLITGDLAKSLREKLKGCAHVQALPVISEHQSSDGTVKWLFDVALGMPSKAVLFPKMIGERFAFHPRQVVQWDAGFVPPATRVQSKLDDRRNCCTAMVCRAHASQAAGDDRQGDFQCRHDGDGRALAKTMLRSFLRCGSCLMTTPMACHAGVTVSTSGVVPMMDRLAQDCPVALAVSLHAPNDSLRDDLVPLNRKYPVQGIDGCLQSLSGACAARFHHL